jgi:Flp pilus assembly protein TadG
MEEQLMSLLSRFRKDGSGNVAMLFGLAIIPILGIAGAAVDYARASSARATLDAAVDSAALMVAREANRLTDAQLKTRAEVLIRANLQGNSDAKLGSYTVSVDRTARTVNVKADTSVEASVIKILGIETIPVASNSQAGWGTNKIELALVLDNTGSMASSGKMTALKQASLDLLKIMKEAAAEPDQIKISIVPFATQIRLPQSYADAAWLRFDQNSSEPMLKIKKQNWQGCVADRDQPNDARDGEAIGAQNTLYPGAICAQSTLARIQPLTNDWTTLTNTVNAMTPVGNTNVTIGAIWGLATLTPGAPMVEAAPANTPRLKKYMIVLTDGDNTENRATYGMSSYNANQLINPRTKAACDTAKTAGIKVYTIRVIDGDRNLLRDCASDASMYNEVSNASQLGPVFQQIAREISAIRLTM